MRSATVGAADLSELGDGEREAIVLAEAEAGSLLIVDDAHARRAALSRGVSCLGTAMVLVLAKRRGALDAVAPVLDAMAANRWRLGDDVRREILRLAGEP